MRIFPSNLIKGAKTTLCIQTIKKKNSRWNSIYLEEMTSETIYYSKISFSVVQ